MHVYETTMSEDNSMCEIQVDENMNNNDNIHITLFQLHFKTIMFNAVVVFDVVLRSMCILKIRKVSNYK